MMMSDTMFSPSPDWIPLIYPLEELEPAEEAPATSSGLVPATSSSQLSPKRKAKAKNMAMRRRSRTSRRTPTTLLNADTTNFRALVQQFTGCRTNPSSFKGPVNLSFEGQHVQLMNQSNYHYKSSSVMECPVVYNNIYHHQHHQQQQGVISQPAPIMNPSSMNHVGGDGLLMNNLSSSLHDQLIAARVNSSFFMSSGHEDHRGLCDGYFV